MRQRIPERGTADPVTPRQRRSSAGRRAPFGSAGGLALLAVLLLGAECGAPPPQVVQEVVSFRGYVEPHTPGSGAPEEMPASAPVKALLGPTPDLNTVFLVKTRFTGGSVTRPDAVLVLIPGFLGGATTFDPIARDLVARMEGRLEVWAIDRRPNALEDRLGATFAEAGADDPACLARPPQPSCPIFQGAQFYYPDLDVPPLGDFPGPGDLDLDLDGQLDAQQPLVDARGVSRLPLLMGEDDVRFMAHWGLDTYFRDWRIVLREARGRVARNGVVILGGHSQGTTWASTFAAYDFDPDPARVEAGYSLIDGLVLLEGGGVGPGSAAKPDLASYQATVSALAQPGGPDVYLQSFGPIPLQDLATAGEVSAIAAYHQPFEPALIQRTPTFGSGLLSFLLGAPATNRALAGMFLDDDFSAFEAFRASMGFSDDGPNLQLGPPLLPTTAYLAQPAAGGGLRQWRSDLDPGLPTCPPNVENVSPGCAIVDNGPPSDPNDPNAAPHVNGVEREVTDVDTFLQTQFGKANGFEWYFAAGRPSLDFAYGNDSSALVAEHLASVDPQDEGPLVVTQNAHVDVPVLAIGGSNGLAPEPKSFARYLASIATPVADQEVHILEGYAHLDVISARDNEATPLLVDFLKRAIARRR